MISKSFRFIVIFLGVSIAAAPFPIRAESDEYMLGMKIGAIASICHQLSDLKERYCSFYQTSQPNTCLVASTNFLTEKYKTQVVNGFVNSPELNAKYSRDARYVDDVNFQTAMREAGNEKQKACMMIWNKLLSDREQAIYSAKQISSKIRN